MNKNTLFITVDDLNYNTIGCFGCKVDDITPNFTSMNKSYPMRCVQSKDFGYIFNAWSDGETLYSNESKMGLTYKAMKGF